MIKTIKLPLYLFIFLFFINFSNAQEQIGANLQGDFLGDNTGYSVSISDNGQRVAVGAPEINASQVGDGVVKVYELKNGNWEQLGNTIAGETPHINAGSKIALSGDGHRIVLGSAFRNNGASGKLRIFELLGSNWTEIGQRLGSSGGLKSIGMDVDISSDGNKIIFSEKITTSVSEVSGLVQVYEWSEDQWVQMGSDITTPSLADGFGQNVAISNNGMRIAVAAYLYTATGTSINGAAYVYEWINNKWEEIGLISGTEFGSLGNGLDLSEDGSTLVISGSLNWHNDKPSAGVTQVYGYEDQNWSQIGQSIGGDNIGDQLGWKSVISGDGKTIAISSDRMDELAKDGGQARIYTFDGSAWQQKLNSINGQNEKDNLGYAIDLSANGQNLIVGARQLSGESSISLGYAQVWNFEETANLTELLALNRIEIFPNPASSFIQLRDLESIVVSYQIFNSSGQLQSVSYENKRFDVRHLSPGIYFIEGIQNGKPFRSKFVKI